MSPPAKSSTNTREKDIMFDKDMEKDDFSSWSMKSQDDPMDFGFELPKNNKKSAFKLDMGFDLDGDFGKLSSFKMDMPDFDFSSPPESATKTKESSDDKSSGNFKQKKDLFAFSYDFDALDGFDLDSSPPKKGSETTSKTMDCEEIVAGRKIEKPEALDFDLDLPITRKGVSMASTDVKAKASSEKENQNSKNKTMDCDEIVPGRKIEKPEALDFDLDLPVTRKAVSMASIDVKAKASSEKENQNSKTSDTLVVDNSTSLKQATLNSMENSKAVESPQSPRKINSQTNTMCLQPPSAGTSSLKPSCPMVEEEIDEPCPSYETAALSPSHASETADTAENSPDIEEARSSIIKGNCPRDSDQNAYNKMICTSGLSYEKPEPDISAQLCLDMTEQEQGEMSTDTQTEIGDESKRELCDPDIGHPQTTTSGKISSGTRPSQTSQVQDSSAKLPPALSNSLRGVKDLNAMQNKDSGLIRSKFFKNPEKPGSRVLEPSPSRTESRSITRESTGLILNPTIDRRRDIKDVLPGANTRACPVELVNTHSERNAAKDNTSSNSHEKIIHKDHSNASTVEKLVGQLDRQKLQTKNTTKVRSILQINSSSKLDVSSLTQKLSSNLGSGVEPLQKSKLVSLERPKLVNIMSDLRGSKTQRTNGVNTNNPNSPLQPEVTSSINKEIKAEPPIKISSEMLHNFLHRPLKRKALDEDADRSLKPQLKRVSISPIESRNVGIIVQTKFSNQETKTDNTTKELINDNPQTIINMAKLEIPITETDDNVEKAEGYTKELDNICNSLRKKHEEVKELLVRAVVNNNTLLMLNHPLYEDKILKLKKFAAKLTSETQHMIYTPTTVA